MLSNPHFRRCSAKTRFGRAGHGRGCAPPKETSFLARLAKLPALLGFGDFGGFRIKLIVCVKAASSIV